MGEIATGLTLGTQVAKTLNEAPQDNQPQAVLQGPSSRVTVTVVSLAALAIIGAATANFLPDADRFSLFDSVSLPKFDRLSLPKFDRIALPGFKSTPPPAPAPARVAAAPPPPKPAPPPQPDPIVNAALRDIQSSQRDIQSTQQQNATSLVLLRDGSATQQTELKRISRQLTALTAQVEALHGAVGPLTTSSIPHSNPRARLTRGSKRAHTPPPAPEPPLSKPVGPVSVGGAPLALSPSRSGV